MGNDNNKVRCAICFDFDGTLGKGNMQDPLIEELGYKNPEEFWEKVNDYQQQKEMGRVLAWMYFILKDSKEKGLSLTKNKFKEIGKKVNLFSGVNDNFFGHISGYAQDKGITIEYYIISSGLKSIIEGCLEYNGIRNFFKVIFASEFLYEDNSNEAIWPAVAIDYTNKTQYLFRINKGIENVWNDKDVNKYIPDKKRDIPFERIIYIGDNENDIPAMKMVNYKGGFSIAVYDPDKIGEKESEDTPRDVAIKLVVQERAKYIAPANYTFDNELVKIIKLIIDKISESI
jgi:2-hydroxy-3-keto-5-methylthiopentenyl-1-phosphate phosphatase